MNTIVCVKQVPNPEIPSGKFLIDPEAKQIIPPEGIPPVINPDDERAVELALRVREKYGGKITVLTLGSTGSESVAKHSIAMGVDEGIILSDPAFDGSDSFGTAHILVKAIQKIGNYDIIFCGRQAADWDEGLTGSIIAENLTLPLVVSAAAVDRMESELRIKRVTLDGYQLFAVPIPAVVTVGPEIGRPRLPSGRGIIIATRKHLPIWDAKEIGVNPDDIGVTAARRKLIRLFAPKRERKCEIIQGETQGEAGTKLAERLREAGII